MKNDSKHLPYFTLITERCSHISPHIEFVLINSIYGVLINSVYGVSSHHKRSCIWLQQYKQRAYFSIPTMGNSPDMMQNIVSFQSPVLKQYCVFLQV